MCICWSRWFIGMSSDKISFLWKKTHSQVLSFISSNGQMEVIIFRWSHITLFFITFSLRQQMKYCIISLLLNSSKISRLKSSFSICNLTFSSAFVNWSKAFWSFLSAFPLLFAQCAVCFAQSVVPRICLWILAALLSLGVPESVKEGNVGTIPRGIHPAPSSSKYWPWTAVWPLLGSSASSSWSQAANRKSQLHQLPPALLLLYNTGDHMKGLLSLFKGLLATSTALPAACSHWAGNLSWQRHS